MHVGLPAAGRRVLAAQAEMMLCRELPKIVDTGLVWQNLPERDGQSFPQDARKQLEASINAVFPALVRRVASAPFSNRSLTTRSCPPRAANIRAVKPDLSCLKSIVAPSSRSIAASSVCPYKAAIMRGARPCLLFLSTFAPPSTSSRASRTSPLAAMSISGVWP